MLKKIGQRVSKLGSKTKKWIMETFDNFIA